VLTWLRSVRINVHELVQCVHQGRDVKGRYLITSVAGTVSTSLLAAFNPLTIFGVSLCVNVQYARAVHTPRSAPPSHHVQLERNQGKKPAFFQDWSDNGYDVRVQERRGGPEQMLDEALMVRCFHCLNLPLRMCALYPISLCFAAGAHGKPVNSQTASCPQSRSKF
jgi:hypothetical protein